MRDRKGRLGRFQRLVTGFHLHDGGTVGLRRLDGPPPLAGPMAAPPHDVVHQCAQVQRGELSEPEQAPGPKLRLFEAQPDIVLSGFCRVLDPVAAEGARQRQPVLERLVELRPGSPAP